MIHLTFSNIGNTVCCWPFSMVAGFNNIESDLVIRTITLKVNPLLWKRYQPLRFLFFSFFFLLAINFKTRSSSVSYTCPFSYSGETLSFLFSYLFCTYFSSGDLSLTLIIILFFLYVCFIPFGCCMSTFQCFFLFNSSCASFLISVYECITPTIVVLM